MQEYFSRVAGQLGELLRGDEVFTATFSAEESDFVRFNRNAVRQAGSVTQRTLRVDLIDGRRHAAGGLSLSGDFEMDRPRLEQQVAKLREVVAVVPDDPFLLYSTEVRSSERHGENRLPDGRATVADIQTICEGRDLVGLWAAGASHTGFANSLGQRNWGSSYSYNFDWSFYLEGDKAVKSGYAGFEWERLEFERKVSFAGEQLSALERPPRTIEPGRYRVYLAPAALDDIVGMLSWGGFGVRAHRTKTSPLIRMVEHGARLHPSLTILENTRDGVAPDFQEQGFIRPDSVTLIQAGTYREALVSPRSSVEYGLPTNAASAMEAPASVDVAAGVLPAESVLRELGTGVYVSNLHYLNYSDRNACRTTGMTRFATFWVEDGVIRAPIEVMRFDETVYRMLGEKLVGLTAEREMILNPMTYGRRSDRSAHLPGALIDDFTFTL